MKDCFKEKIFKLLDSYTEEQMNELIDAYNHPTIAEDSIVRKFASECTPEFNETPNFGIQVVAMYTFIAEYLWNKQHNQVITLDAPEMVDLGLPSGLKWAKWNVGATKETEYGKFFAWGDTVGSEATSEGCKGKYNDDLLITITSNLTLEQDAAHVAYGGNYRMPTEAEIKELRENTKYSKATINGVKGGKFTAKNGNYIFFPFAGYGRDGSHHNRGDEAGVWSSSYYNGDFAWNLCCYGDYYSVYIDGCRRNGYSVRAVCK